MMAASLRSSCEEKAVRIIAVTASEAPHLSRSTSAGSAGSEERESSLEKTLSYPHMGSCSQLPDYDYPTPLVVRNTFIDTPLDRPYSLDGFLQERRIQSCPVEAPGVALVSQDEEEEEDAALASKLPQLRRAATAGAAVVAAAAADTAAAVMGWWHGQPQEQQQQAAAQWNETFVAPDRQDFAQMPTTYYESQQASSASPPVLLLSEALAPPSALASNAALGSPELPTIGSLEHWTGNCKPCAFFHKRGCSNGVECSFCHLCDSSEKKRRQKEKVQQLREMRRQGVTPA